MQRAGVLIEKLQQQLAEQADVQKLLVTAQLLHSELLTELKAAQGNEPAKVAVMVANVPVATEKPVVEKSIADDFLPSFKAGSDMLPEIPVFADYKPQPKPEPIPEPVAEPENPLPAEVPMPTPKPEPEPIPHFVEQKPWERFVASEEKASVWGVDPMVDIPTLSHQHKVVYELNDVMVEEAPASINDRLKEEKVELGTTLVDTPVKDLKRAISINDRMRFINELFRGDETMYERSIKTINSFHIYAEAEFWIQRELKVKLGWDTSLELVKNFDQLVKRRFA